MADYILRIPWPTGRDPSKLGSTAGDSSIGNDQWLWTPQTVYETPSKKLGMRWAEEVHQRARAVNWIVRISIALQLPQLIIATAAAYVHRFYMRKPLQKYSPKMISATALFLATKVEEVPRKLEHVIREYLSVDEDGNERAGPISDSSNEFQALKHEILYYEDILLRSLCFDLSIDHPYVSLIHCAKSIHESHARARTPTPSLAVEMADRAKAKSITQAAWGFVNDSLMSPLCLVARPELIAAAAFLLAVSHRLSESPASDWEQQADPQEPRNLENNPTTQFNSFLNMPTRDGPEEEPTQEPWWKAFQVESLDEIHLANAMIDQYTLSVSDYIRDRAGKLARFPGPSFLSGPVEIKENHPSLTGQADSVKCPEKVNGQRTPLPLEDDRSRAISSTPSRAMMSDNMDLGTPNESAGPSPKSQQMISPVGPTNERSPTKRSRSPDSSSGPSKNPRLDLPSSVPSSTPFPPLPQPPSASPPPLPPSIPNQPSPPPPSDPHPPHVSQSPPPINTIDPPKETDDKLSEPSPDSSLTDMEEGELD
ncbi:hypothetical protein, variant [Puccinia triticina 1-1 BBBD Race 1]|uniref:Cyclin-like domain-containing protein n=1 Tax=Puccinia triticina (isolate 1-1 / race 1 (BBBD)) TaxID=630390 RepID=A0A180GHR2_PUCT1|nr:hypothetical protein, variant [Puccinia triticina 1-1 BBBD Race 1]